MKKKSNYTYEPYFLLRHSKILWKKIYFREYGVQYSQTMFLSVSSYAKKPIPSPVSDHIIIPEDNGSAMYADYNSWIRLSKSLANKYAATPAILSRFEKEFIKEGQKYVRLTKRISSENVSKLSNVELLTRYLKYQNEVRVYTTSLATIFIVNNYLSEVMMNLIEKYLIKHQFKEDQKQQIIDVLLSPHKQASIIKLHRAIQKTRSTEQQTILFEKYKWFPCQDIHNKPWTKGKFLRAIKEVSEVSKTKAKSLMYYVKILGIHKKDHDRLLVLRRLAYLKDLRDEYRRKAIYNVLPFFSEIAKRMKISRQDISYLLDTEIVDFLENNLNPDLKKVDQRKEKGFSMYFNQQKKFVFLEGQQLAKVLQKYKFPTEDTQATRVVGTVASRGTAKGIVAIISTTQELNKIKKGHILVAKTTHPDYTLAMRRAAAIVTDEGGITSHAAIVAREFGIPCIVGTQNATNILKDGMYVTVDAKRGVVEIE